MFVNTSLNGWNRIATGIDLEVQHGVPVRLSATRAGNRVNPQSITDRVQKLTGLSVTLNNWINIAVDEQESSVCIEKREFVEVLRRLALSSAAMFVDRYHRAIDRNAVDWDSAEYNYDFTHAMEYCCIPYGMLNKDHYFEDYIKTMHRESVRLIEDGIAPIVDAE